jgi:hypothetical protein
MQNNSATSNGGRANLIFFPSLRKGYRVGPTNTSESVLGGYACSFRYDSSCRVAQQ